MRDMDVQSGAVTSAMRDGVDEAPDVCCGTCAAWATLDGCAGLCTHRLDAYAEFDYQLDRHCSKTIGANSLLRRDVQSNRSVLSML